MTGRTSRIAILVPVLRRPANVQPLLDSIRENTPESHRVLFLCDAGDWAEQDAIALAGGEMLSPGGNYAHKINAGVAATDEPLLFFGADDLRFHPGWLEAIEAVRALTWASVIGTQDLCNPRVIRGEHATHFAVTRSYAQLPTIDDQPGPLYEGYMHEYVDDELIGTAKKRKTYAFAEDAIVEHLHPDVGKAKTDALYADRHRRMRASRALFLRRQALWT